MYGYLFVIFVWQKNYLRYSSARFPILEYFLQTAGKLRKLSRKDSKCHRNSLQTPENVIYSINLRAFLRT